MADLFLQKGKKRDEYDSPVTYSALSQTVRLEMENLAPENQA